MDIYLQDYKVRTGFHFFDSMLNHKETVTCLPVLMNVLVLEWFICGTEALKMRYNRKLDSNFYRLCSYISDVQRYDWFNLMMIKTAGCANRA